MQLDSKAGPYSSERAVWRLVLKGPCRATGWEALLYAGERTGQPELRMPPVTLDEQWLTMETWQLGSGKGNEGKNRKFWPGFGL